MWKTWAFELRDVLLLIGLFGVTILVHELGHFLMARRHGLRVDTFSIGFGPAIWKRRVRGTLYKIGCLPVGGYVSLPQLDPAGMSVLQGKSRDPEVSPPLPPAPAGSKIAVALAGAGGNLLLAVAIAWLVYAVGMPLTTEQQDTVIGYVDPASAAFAAGLRTGDRILSVQDRQVQTWGHLVQEAALHNRVRLGVLGPDGTERIVEVDTEPWPEFAIRTIPGISPRNVCRVASVTPGLSAAESGIQPQDVIVHFADIPVLSRGHLVELVAQHRNRTVPVVVRRMVSGQAEEIEFQLTPQWDERARMTRIGIEFAQEPPLAALDVRIHPRPGRQLWHHATTIVRFLRHLVTPRVARRAAEQVGGPVAILSYYVGIIKASLMLAIWFTGFLNVNLAVINLLPIPVLDGGHVLFALWELLTRRPLPARVAHALVNTFAVLLVAMMILLSLRDLDRFTPIGRQVRSWFQRRSETVSTEPRPDVDPDALPIPRHVPATPPNSLMRLSEPIPAESARPLDPLAE